jgi:serine/threonine protein kinase
MIDQIFQRLNHDLAERTDLSYLIRTSDNGAHTKLTVFAFERNGSSPKYVAKVAVYPEGNKQIEHEVNVIKHLRENEPGLEKYLPTIIDAGLLNGAHAYFVTSYQVGTSLEDILTAEGFEKFSFCDYIGSFLVSLQEIRSRENPIFDGEVFFKNILANLDGRLSPKLFDSIVTASRYQYPPWRCSAVHGDFLPKNILVDENGAVKIFDWEFFESGLPFIDFFHFHIFTYRKLNNCDLLSTIGSLFIQETDLSRHFYSHMNRFFIQSGTNLADVRLALIAYLCWLQNRELKGSRGPEINTEAAFTLRMLLGLPFPDRAMS